MSRLNNSFTFAGRVGSEPEKRFNQKTGDAIMVLSLAVDSSYKNRETDELVKRTEWIDLTVFRKGLIDIIDKYVKKGSGLTVRGTVRKQVWESKDRTNEDGSPKNESRYQFIVSDLLLGARPKGEEGEGHQADSAGVIPEEEHFDDSDMPF